MMQIRIKRENLYLKLAEDFSNWERLSQSSRSAACTEKNGGGSLTAPEGKCQRGLPHPSAATRHIPFQGRQNQHADAELPETCGVL